MDIQNSSKAYDIITFGDMCVDLIITGEDVVPEFGQVEKLVSNYEIEMGGSCNIFACQAAKLGFRVGVLGRVGADDFGQLILRRLQECGVDTQHVVIDPALKTGLGVALCRGNDRAILTYMGSLCAITPEDVHDTFLASAHHLHHGSFFLHTQLRPKIPEILQRAKFLGLTTSLDTNWDPEETWNSTLAAALQHTDIFLPNEQEAMLISGTHDIQEAIQAYEAARIPITVIKRGEEGVFAAINGQHLTYTLPRVAGGDSIGAGDSFDAGFLAGWLQGYSPEHCLAIASHCGREVARQTGGLMGQPDWNRILDLVKNLPG